MQQLIRHRLAAPISLLVLGFLTRFAFIWNPSEVVFDEVHFGKFVNGYLTGNYFFDIHPPLGKLILTIGALIGGHNPEFGFNNIGQSFPDYSYVFLRLFSCLFGALLPVCIYYFIISLRGSRVCALLGGLAVVFENALLTQSHFILIDSIYLFFSFAGITFYFFYRNYNNNVYYLIVSGVMLGFAISVKWIALSFIGLVWAVSFIDLDRLKFNIEKSLQYILFLIAVPIVIYYLIFSIHFAILDKSGMGDAFMTPGFKKTLMGSDSENNSSVKASGNLKKFTELNKTMLHSNAGITADHPYASRFYLWPAMIKPIYYWYKKVDENQISRIYLFGNPFVWLAGLCGFLLGAFLWFPENREIKWILYSGWIFNMLPFMNIKRPLFLYHYFPALIFSVLIFSFLIADKLDISKKSGKIGLGIIAGIFVLGFIFFSPLTYGLVLSPGSFDLRFWLQSWR